VPSRLSRLSRSSQFLWHFIIFCLYKKKSVIKIGRAFCAALQRTFDTVRLREYGISPLVRLGLTNRYSVRIPPLREVFVRANE
jgi:hypothetical protein